MAARSQYFPAVNFATMRDGETITVAYEGELPYVIVSADGRVKTQRAAGRELSYQIDEAAKTITFLMCENKNFGRIRNTSPAPASHPQTLEGSKKGSVSSLQGRKKPAPTVQAIPNQKLGMRERMLRSFWREAYIASLSAGDGAQLAESHANTGLADYDRMMSERDAAILKESARG